MGPDWRVTVPESWPPLPLTERLLEESPRRDESVTGAAAPREWSGGPGRLLLSSGDCKVGVER